MMMNIIAWNCRGVGSKSFPGLIRDLKVKYEASLMFLFETHRAWGVTAVYGSPHRALRQSLWDEIRDISHDMVGPWCAIGDFNAFLHASEKEGGSSSAAYGPCREFQSCLMECGLEDLGFNGCPFTWHRGDLKERLDRVIVNTKWRVRFEEVSLFHLPLFKSDHVPFWIRFTQPMGRARGNRPFRFLTSWLTHDDFNELVKRTWKFDEGWNSNVVSFTKAVKLWNSSFFGNITYRKHQLMNHLHGISRSLSNGWNPFLINLQKELLVEYERVLYQEEVLWLQKSRCKWLKHGDKNTTFFHGTTIFRRKRQRIEAYKTLMVRGFMTKTS